MAQRKPPSARRGTVGNRAALPGEVRLIGGRWKRSKLTVAARPGLRPTPSRVRQTLFDWLGQDLSGWRCLDAFAGSGALGFEAASRGAAHVRLVERDAGLAAALLALRQRLGATMVEVVCGDALAALGQASAASYELVFLDPPYDAGLLEPALAACGRVVAPGGFVYAEAGHALQAPAGHILHRHGRAGAVFHHLFRRVGPEQTLGETPAQPLPAGRPQPE